MKQKKTIAQRMMPKALPESVKKEARRRAQIEFDQFVANGVGKIDTLPTNQLKLF